MRFTVQYIPLHRIEPQDSRSVTKHIKRFRRLVSDCMHVIVVRKQKRGRNYTIVTGKDRYDFLVRHTNQKHAPCIVEYAKRPGMMQRLRSLRNRKMTKLFPDIAPERLKPASRSIIRSFLRQEPRFHDLPRHQQIKILLLGVRYKKTTVRAMKAKVEEWTT